MEAWLLQMPGDSRATDVHPLLHLTIHAPGNIQGPILRRCLGVRHCATVFLEELLGADHLFVSFYRKEQARERGTKSLKVTRPSRGGTRSRVLGGP